MILGKIEFPYAGETLTAELDAGLRWHCPAQTTIEGLLNSEFVHYSPADGQPGARLLHDAAKFLKGDATWLAPEPAVALPGTVY